jgi:hypothetical protein
MAVIFSKTNGQNHPGAKLNCAEVKHIVRCWMNGVQQQSLAALFCVHPRTISGIVNRKTYFEETTDVFRAAKAT